MGFFNRYKKKETQAPIHEESIIKSNIEYSITKDGKLQIDYHDNERNVGKMYDVTRLIFTNNSEELNNKNIPECLVSWYGSDDAIMIDRNGIESGRRVDYREVLADIDIRLMQTDQKYCEYVMKALLRESRVEDYLEKGLEDSPQHPCGEYIGGVRRNANENRYEKFFDVRAGKDAHNKSKMIEKRNWYKEMMERRKQAKITRNKAEIERLQGEIDEWSK